MGGSLRLVSTGQISRPSSLRSTGGEIPPMAGGGKNIRGGQHLMVQLTRGNVARPVHQRGNVHAAIERAEFVSAKRPLRPAVAGF